MGCIITLNNLVDLVALEVEVLEEMVDQTMVVVDLLTLEEVEVVAHLIQLDLEDLVDLELSLFVIPLIIRSQLDLD